MKSLLCLSILFCASKVFATSYVCTGKNNESIHVFQELPDQAVVVLQSSSGHKILSGKYTQSFGRLYNVTEFDLQGLSGEKADLTLSQKMDWGRGGCTRVSCDSRISNLPLALLKMGEQTKQFQCL